MNHGLTLTRSKSDEFPTKPLVLSPTPIRRANVSVLNEIFNYSSYQQEDEAIEREKSESPIIVRKFLSLDIRDMGGKL